ncbi:hypothetical protein I546_0239 [Mycobacterium kansasii 732]|nr:hypothetical protein I546_0239 [Mycobacterium kansasii 732]
MAIASGAAITYDDIGGPLSGWPTTFGLLSHGTGSGTI